MEYVDQRDDSINNIIRTIYLNEIAIGQREEYVKNELNTYCQEKLNVKFNDYYILLTGIKKEVYHGVYHIEAGDYWIIFNAAKDTISKYMTDHGFDHEIFLYLYFNTKQICMFFNKGDNSEFEVEKFAEYVNELIQQMNEEEIFHGEKRFFNFTTVSPLLKDYHEIKQTFLDLQEIGKLSFFHNKSMVMTDKKLQNFRKKFTYSQAYNIVTDIIDSISIGQVKLCQEKTRDLFLENMRYSYDIPLCWDILTELKSKVYHFDIIYDLNLDDEIEKNFKLNAYSNIYEMYESIDNILQVCTYAALKNGNGIGYISQAAIKFIKDNYYEDISLISIASHVKVVPTYLSEIFNKEIGMSIPQYLTKLRIEKSKKLLSESSLKIFEVANSVGIKDANYFGKVFKKQVGVTPQQYQKKHL